MYLIISRYAHANTRRRFICRRRRDDQDGGVDGVWLVHR